MILFRQTNKKKILKATEPAVWLQMSMIPEADK